MLLINCLCLRLKNIPFIFYTMSPWDSMKQKYRSEYSTVLELIGSIEASQIHKSNTDELQWRVTYREVQTAQRRMQRAHPCVSWFTDICLTYLKNKKKRWSRESSQTCLPVYDMLTLIAAGEVTQLTVLWHNTALCCTILPGPDSSRGWTTVSSFQFYYTFPFKKYI